MRAVSFFPCLTSSRFLVFFLFLLASFFCVSHPEVLPPSSASDPTFKATANGDLNISASNVKIEHYPEMDDLKIGTEKALYELSFAKAVIDQTVFMVNATSTLSTQASSLKSTSNFLLAENGLAVSKIMSLNATLQNIKNPLASYEARLSATDISSYVVLLGGDGVGAGTVMLYSEKRPLEWQYLPPMLDTFRGQGALAFFYDHGLFALGGFGSYELSSVESFDLNTYTWTQKTNSFAAHYGAVGLLLTESKFFVAAGYYSGNSALSDLNEFYDASTDQWEAFPSHTVARAYACTAKFGSKMLMAGGKNSNYLTSCELFDPWTGVWSTCANLQSARAYAAAVAYGGAVYVFGGKKDNTNPLSSVEKILTSSWSTVEALPYSRYSHSAAVVNNKLVLFGGFSGSGESFVNDSITIFNPSTDKNEYFSTMNSLLMGPIPWPLQRTLMSAVSFQTFPFNAPAPNKTLTGWVTPSISTSYAYLWVPTFMNVDSAENFCINQSSHLISILSVEENAFIVSLIPASFTGVWLGTGGLVDGEVVWYDGLNSDPKFDPYSNWAPGQPNGAVQAFFISPLGQWASSSVSYLPFICKRAT